MNSRWALPIALVISCVSLAAEKKDERGLLPDLRMNSDSEIENEKRGLQTELLITAAETKAISSLQNIIKRKKGTAEEPDLLHRLAEMYMRRARTGRFMDLNRTSATSQLSSFPLPPEKGLDWVRKASETYGDVEKRFPKYRELDSVLFNNAFCNQQLGQVKKAEDLYQRLIEKNPNSRLVPDASIALGELAYDQRRFALALHHFEVAAKIPNSRVMTYALYKAAWTNYNLKDTDQGIARLLDVVKACPIDGSADETRDRQSLRREALRDLALFVGDSRPADDFYSFFKAITTEDELGQSMMDLAKLNLSHSRFKEMNIFLGEFLSKHGNNPSVVKSYLTLVDANESLKDRDQVLKSLSAAAERCRVGSDWRKLQSAETIQDACTSGFHVKSHEIASKWWDIWQKNKTHQEFSSLTERALKIVLDNEDANNPDLNSRFGYAELLFQLGRYEDAALNYALVGDARSTAAAETKKAKIAIDKDGPSAHDADYGALYSIEKALEKKVTDDLKAKRKMLAETYLKRHPEGTHAGTVTLHMAVLSHEAKDLDAAEKWLTGPLAGKFGRELQRKAEDLELDILNIRKNFTALAAKADLNLKKETDPARRESLKKIELEASYSGLQERIKALDSAAASKELRLFAESHASTSLASEALAQAIAKDFIDGHGLAAADGVALLLKQNPQHPKLNEALKDAARASAEAGDMSRAAELLQNLAERDPKNKSSHLEAAADFLLMENRLKDARAQYNLLLPIAPAADRSRLYTKLLETFKGESDSSEVRRLENLVLSQNLEPFATKILTRRAQSMLDAGQATQAFEAARKIVARDAPAGERASARLIQAKILEDEFTRQSVKSANENRLSLVLSLKIEKLEKAQTAFLSVSKMTTDPNVLTAAFTGIDRCYGQLVDALEHMPAPASLSADDQKAFKGEIAKVVAPFRDKREENRKEIQKLSAVAAASARDRKWNDLGGEASPPPALPEKWTFLKTYVPRNWPTDVAQVQRASPSNRSCDAKKPEFATCFTAGNHAAAEQAARALTQTKETRAQGLHHLALVAEAREQYAKALWLLKLAETAAPSHPLVHFEKGRVLVQLEGTASASADFAKVLDTSMSSTEIEILRGFKAFSEGDFAAVKKLFSGFSRRELYDLNLGMLLSESLAQLGDTEKALILIDEIATLGRSPELLIQKGHLEEVYKFAPVPALEAYAQAAKLSKDPAQKLWLERKLEYLKVNFKVGLNVTSGD